MELYCGDGSFLALAAKMGFDAIGVDGKEENIQRCQIAKVSL